MLQSYCKNQMSIHFCCILQTAVDPYVHDPQPEKAAELRGDPGDNQ